MKREGKKRTHKKTSHDSKFPGLKTLTPHRPPQPKPTRLNPDDCQELLNGWLRLLRSGLGVVSSGGGYTRLV